MTKYEFAFKQEILMEVGAGILGDIFRYESDHNISDSDNLISKLYSLVWNAKRDILFAKTEVELFRIEGKFELARALITE